MKVYFKIVGIVGFVFGCLGFVFPNMVSSSDPIIFGAGITFMVCFLPVLYLLIKWSTK